MVARTREIVLNALFTQLKTCGSTFKLYTRRWVPWIDDPTQSRPDMPFLVQWESPVAETYVGTPGSGLPPKRLWDVTLLAYGMIPVGQTPGVPDSTTPAASVLNPLIDAIENALSPDDPNGLLTLGGLVVDCCIDGEIVKALGDADPSGVAGAIIPVKILVQ